MTDRELLELAAKAYWGDEIDDVVSVEWSEPDQGIAYTHGENQDHNGNDVTLIWNPLEDDGGALRLAVKLRMDVNFNATDVCAFPEDGRDGAAEAVYVADPYAATRRAIVRAAAQIGMSHNVVSEG